MNSDYETILKKYGVLLRTVDQWFSNSATSAGDSVLCGKGCSSCCRGLFDITLLDAFYLRHGFDKLSNSVQDAVLSRVTELVSSLRSIWQDVSAPYIINVLPEEDWDRLMPEEDTTPCPLLGDDGLCLVYEYRPMTCRLHGIPLVDISGEIFHDEWCTWNFKNEDPLEKDDLRWKFRECFQEELSIFRDFTDTLFNQKINELDTLLPLSVLIDFHGFDWKEWWQDNSLRIRNGGFPERR